MKETLSKGQELMASLIWRHTNTLESVVQCDALVLFMLLIMSTDWVKYKEKTSRFSVLIQGEGAASGDDPLPSGVLGWCRSHIRDGDVCGRPSQTALYNRSTFTRTH